MNKTMKTLDRNFGVSIAWNHERFESGDYILIHTRSTHMAADIYTKGFRSAGAFERLRRLINIYSLKEIESGEFSPSSGSYDTRDVEGIDVDPSHANPHYTYVHHVR